MNLVSCRCPKCSAQLRIDPEMEQIKCDYCGSTLWLENALSPDMRDKLLEKKADRLAEIIHDLIEPAKRLKLLNVQKDSLSRELPNLKKKAELAGSSTGKNIPFIAGGAIVLFFLVLSIMAGNFGLFSFGVIAGLAGFMIIRSNMSTYISLAVKKESMLSEVSSEIEQINKSNDFNILPAKYLFEDAMTFFVDSLKNRRALSLQQAINLYEDELQKRELKALQQEQIELQKAQIEELKNNRNVKANGSGKSGDININIDGLATAGGLLAAGLAVARFFKDDL